MNHSNHRPISKSFARRRRRQFTPPIPAKKCTIRHASGQVMDYDVNSETLILNEHSWIWVTFPSKQRAHAAIYRTLQAGTFKASDMIIEDCHE